MARGEVGAAVKTVLVVDDSPAMRECLREVFEGAGYRVFEAAYLLGVEFMATINSQVDAVVMDGHVPFAERQDSISSLPLAVTLHGIGVRVIFHSGDDELSAEAAAKGFTVVPKGSGVQELLKAVGG